MNGLKQIKGVLAIVLHFALQDAIKQWLTKLLHAMFKDVIIESVIKLFFCMFAVYIAVFKSFGEIRSLWISSILFIGVFLWSIVESVLKYYMLLVLIVKERSLQTGIVKFVEWKFPEAEIGSRLYSKVCFFLLGCSRSSSEIIRDFICSLAKDIIAFVSVYFLYIILVYWIFEPIILEKFAGLTTLQIYLFPIRQFL